MAQDNPLFVKLLGLLYEMETNIFKNFQNIKQGFQSTTQSLMPVHLALK